MSNGQHILIIDPSPIFRGTLKNVIRTSHPLVDISEVGEIQQAEEILKTRPADVVFLDIALPGNNGVSFIAKIKQIEPEACIVVLSSHDSVEYRNASIQNGADYFLSKQHSNGLQLIDVIRETM